MSEEATYQAIATMSDALPLAVFVGAGLPKEAGLPSWPELIDCLLRVTARRSEPFRVAESDLTSHGAPWLTVESAMELQASQYARWITASHGVLGAASVVKAWLPSADYRRTVARCLYRPLLDAQLPVEPGPTAVELARLWLRRGADSLTVVTTNYDLLIERALVLVGADPRHVNTAIHAGAMASEMFNVVHLHGVISETEADGGSPPFPGSIVLAEDEFFAPSDDITAHERRAFCESLLSETPCLFIGTSFTDPNLLTYLYNSQIQPDHASGRFAVVVKQGEQSPQLDATTAVLEAGRLAAAERLTRMSVTALQPDFFCQTGHLLADISRTADGTTYSQRLESWSSAAHFAGILPGTTAFGTRQHRLQQALAAGVAAIRSTLDSKPSLRCTTERLALHLWAHEPEDGSLVFGARSDMLFADPSMLERLPISMPIERLVVEAVCSGSCLEASGDDLQSSRWRSMLVVPITTDLGACLKDGSPIGGVPAGAVVLASDQDSAQGLARLKSAPADRSYLIAALAAIGRASLTPDSAVT